MKVDLWTVALREPDADGTAILSAHERGRAARFVYDVHREGYVKAHAAMRRILAGYLDADPASLRYGFGPQGKPRLPDHPDLHFNLSDSHDIALVAVTEGGPVGVDVERVRPLERRDELARRVFTATERDELATLPEAQRTRAFFDGWTRKEAYLKATGDGIWRGLQTFTVTLAPDAPPRFVDLPGWTVVDVRPDADHAAAVVVEAASCDVVRRVLQ